jgi:hypothetical protein
MQEKKKPKAVQIPGTPELDTPFRKKCRMTPVQARGRLWAALIKAVYEACTEPGRSVDLLKCPQCGGTMKIVSFIEEAPVIEKILRHCKLPAEATAQAGGKKRPAHHPRKRCPELSLP